MRKPYERNIILTGMPGSGKTTVGRLVAERLDREFVDSDAEIERREGKTCAEIINTDGESRFRGLEREVIAELADRRGIVLAVGGGAPMFCGELLRKNSVVAYIRRDLEKIAASLDAVSRPLSKSPADLEKLFERRDKTYTELADIHIYNNEDAESAGAAIVAESGRFLNAHLLVVNGPNLNLLGVREPGIYGSSTYADLQSVIADAARLRGIAVRCFQSNHEGAIIDALHEAMGVYDGIVINPGAYTHYSYAIYDALKAINIPAVEVHISDITSREEFRKISVTAPACAAQVFGEGFPGYVKAMDILVDFNCKGAGLMPKQLAVIGSPVAHSRSPAIHTKFAADSGLDYTYTAIEVTRETLADFVVRAKREFAGFNVTMPLKEAIIPFLTSIDGAAKACGSVNTVVNRGGELFGYSTDGIGTVAALREQSPDLRGKVVLLLGTGGAAKSAAFALNEVGCAVTALSRRGEPPCISGAVTRPWAELAALAASADVIINATPLGMHGNAEFEDFDWLYNVKNEMIVFDFVYNPEGTALLSAAKSRRLITIGGLRLLLLQAAASFELFTGVAPSLPGEFFS